MSSFCYYQFRFCTQRERERASIDNRAEEKKLLKQLCVMFLNWQFVAEILWAKLDFFCNNRLFIHICEFGKIIMILASNMGIYLLFSFSLFSLGFDINLELVVCIYIKSGIENRRILMTTWKYFSHNKILRNLNIKIYK